jgi:tol-pal system protein YbgF
MLARSTFSSACLAAVLGVAVCAAPEPARSQDSQTPERLERLERDLNMLQRQVYRGAPQAAVGDPTLAANIEVRMERLEAQMRDLTGRVEETSNQLDQIRQRLEQVNSDVELRFSHPGGPAAAPTSPAQPGPIASAGRPAPRNPGGAQGLAGEPTLRGLTPGTAVPPPEPVFSTLTPPGAGGPEQPTASAAAATGAPLPGGTAAQQYNHAFGLLKQADYEGAEAGFRAFLQQHPQDPMAGNAQYWLGDIYYQRKQYMEAAAAFAEGYKRYPKSSKAAEELLKLGMALGHANQKQNACVAFAQLDREFPHPPATIRERALAEKKRLGCS